MLILFEGPDSTGKTEISNAISKELDIKKFKCSHEHEFFNGKSDRNQELQLIYDTAKFLDLVNQGIIADLVIDRDYVSEYVYGEIFRNNLYKKYNVEEYIHAYDELYFLNELYIIICYKPNFDNFSDELISIKDVELILERYKKFANISLNNILFLDTSDMNLENQVKDITSWIKRLRLLKKCNKKEFKLNSYTNHIFFPGWFRGDTVLFIGQNPGQPFKNDSPGKKLHGEKIDDFELFQLNHNKSYLQSKYYKFLCKFANKLNKGILNSDFSFTNIVKYSTESNRQLTQDEIDSDVNILKKQIKILNPNYIISFGVPAHQILLKHNISHIPYYHPARYFYTKTERILS